MPNISNEECAKKKLDLAAIRTEAKIKRMRSRIMRVKALLMRAQAQMMRDKNRNLRAITQEWFIK